MGHVTAHILELTKTTMKPQYGVDEDDYEEGGGYMDVDVRREEGNMMGAVGVRQTSGADMDSADMLRDTGACFLGVRVIYVGSRKRMSRAVGLMISGRRWLCVGLRVCVLPASPKLLRF